jgi:hypothetical protein
MLDIHPVRAKRIGEAKAVAERLTNLELVHGADRAYYRTSHALTPEERSQAWDNYNVYADEALRRGIDLD